MTMGNYFDKFDGDKPAGGGNFFDQFDESPAGAKPTATDYLKGAASGVGGLVSGAGYLAERVGADQIGGNLRLAGDTAQKAFLKSMTPAGQRAAQSQVFEDDPSSVVPRLGDRWGQALGMGAAQSAPSMLAAAIPGGIAAAGLRGAAGLAASRGIGGALAPLAAGTAAPVGGWGANFAGNVAARAPAALGFGAAEGAVAGASNAAQWKSDIEQRPEQELDKMPGYAQLKAQIGPEAARRQIAEQGAAEIMARTTLATGGIGALTGGGALGSAFQRMTTGAKGGIAGAIARDAAKESGQEIPQSGSERAIQNLATRDYLDPNQSVSQGVAADALSGGAIGGLMGGVTGGASHLAKGPLQKAAEASSATLPPDSRQTSATFPPSSSGAVTPGDRDAQASVARADASVRDLVQAAAAELEADQSPANAPQQQNTPAAPGISPVPVPTAAPSLPTNQAESAGVPIPVSQQQEGAVPRGNETEITKSAAPGQQAQPAAVSGAAGAVGSTGAQPANAGTQPANTGPQPAPVPAPTGQDVNLQNRDRDRAPSIDQMRRIAKNPDYLRAGASRTPDSGAPMVFAVGDDAYRFVAPDAVGNADVAVMSDGQRVPFRYAVVNANAVQPSNFVDGRKNPEFLSSDPGTLKALNNGRAAGIRGAHAIGTAAEYVAAMALDTAAHGIDPGIIVNTPNAMLVRLYSEADNKPGMAARSQGQGLGMSPAELARQDAQMLDSSALELFRPGDVASADNRDFVRAFVGKMQQSGQDIAGMMTDGGMLAPAGRQRIQAALVHTAYGDAGLVSELFDSIDTDIKAIGEALKAVAGAWANMRDSARVGAIAPDVDITDSIVSSVRLIQKARRDRLSLFDLVNQIDIESGSAVDSRTVAALRLFYTGRYLTRAVGKESLTTDLQRYIDLAMATTAGTDMFGERADPAKLLQSITTKDQPDEGKQGSLALSGSPPVGTGAGGERPASPGQRGDEGGDASVQGGGQGGSQGSGNQDAVIVPPSAPAAEAKPKPAQAEKTTVPDDIRNVIARAVAKLRDISDSLDNVVAARGHGHILATELAAKRGEIDAAKARLARVRALAARNGADVESVIAELGGEPDFTRFAAKPATKPDIPADIPRDNSDWIGTSVTFLSPSGRQKRGSVIRVANGKATVVSAIGQNVVDLSLLKRTKGESTPLKGYPASDTSPGHVKSLEYARNELAHGTPHWYVANALADDVLGDNSKLSSAAFAYVLDADNQKLWNLIDSVARSLGQRSSNNGDVRRATAEYVAGRGVVEPESEIQNPPAQDVNALKAREAAKKAEADKAAEEFALGQAAPEPVVKKVTTEEALGQGDIFGLAPKREPLENPEELPPEANAASDDLGALFDNELEAAFSKPKEEGNEPGSVRNPQRDREAADAQRGDAGALSDERGREGAAPGSGVPVPDANRRGRRPGGPGVSGVGAASGGERGDQPVPGTKRPAGVAKLPAGDNQRQGSADVRSGGVAASGGESAAAVGGPAGGGVGPRSASEAGKSAAKNAGLALSDVAKGLNALFKPKPGRLGMGLPFDEDTYAAAKPYFQAGLAHVRQAGADIVDMMRALIAALRDQFGMDKDTIAAMKPYVLRYISDVQAGREAIEETNPQQPPKDKLQQQQAAESIKVIVGDKANIDATLPFLTEGQREDVLFAEKRWAAPDGYGVLFTNGTGTGKTFLALGAIKRLTKRGKGNGIVVVPNEAVMNEWVKSAPALGLQVKPLTDTKDAGSGIAITTYANFGQNDAIAKRDYDFVAIDEAHLLMLGKEAEPTKALDALRAVSLHPDGVLQRAEMQNRELVDRIRATSDQLTSLYRMMNDPDIMDQMYAAYRSEADGLEKKLAADRAKWEAALDAVESDVMARQGEKRTRAIFLSATPFAYEPSIQWGEGYLYDFAQVSGRGYNEPSGYQKFMMQHFGWRMRNGKLTQPPAEVDSDLMQRQFNTWLRKQGVLSARMLDVDHDYERKFILIQGGVGQTIDDGLRWLRETDNGRYWSLYGAINEQFDYLTRSRLLEAIKARAAIPYIKKHHALGRKVVVFYDFNSGGGINVFNLSEQLQRAEAAERMSGYALDKDGVDVPVRGQGKAAYGQIKTEKVPRSQLIREFMAARPELQAIDFSQYGSPLTTLLEAFPGAGVYNGISQYRKTRVQSIRDFNDDAKPEANLLLVQKAANAGWSGHDTTGKHGRVLINLGLPVAPIEAIQEEGRIYRVGQKSDANFQYFNTGTNWERYAFGSKIARRAGTAENLAMGEQARGLREAFVQAFENSDPDYEPGDTDGRGGKVGDRDLVSAITEWDRARSLYFAQQKKTARTKAAEGVDYYATPEPLGLKMVEWAGILPGERVLEPSAGHGAIARWFPEKNDRTVIEPSLELASRLTLATDAKLVNERFENHDTINKYDAIVMNPPFGTGGKTAIDHLDKAFRHLTDGGRVVALIPEGPAANKRFDDWLYGDKQVKAKPVASDLGAFGAVFLGDTATVEVSGMAGIAGGVLGAGTVTGKVTGFREGKLFVKREGEAWATGYRADQIRAVQPTGARTTTVKSAPNAYLRASIGLPGVTFERAGTGVKTRVVIIDKIEGMRASRGVETQPTREIEAASVKDLFDRLENMEVVGRSLPAHKEQEKKQGQDRDAAKAATSGKADDVGLVQPEGSPATIEQLQKPEKAGGKTKLLTDAPRVKHVVASSGKELFGVIAMRLTRNEAKSVDPYSWPKDGGFFIRMEHVVRPASVAEQERAVYNVHEPDGITGDLFRGTTPDLFAGTDHALPAAARTNLHRERATPERAARPAPRPVARVLAVRQAPDAPGLYHVSTQLVTVGERELPVERIRSIKDAAAAFAYLPRFAVEHYDAIVTDKDGKPLAIIGGFKGDIGSTNAPPSTLIGELSRIDGASRLWTAHNHPSGLAMLSAADRRLDEGLRNALDGSGVEYYGLFSMVGAGSRSGVVRYDHTQVGSGEVRRSRQPLVRVPIVERELTDRRDEVEKIDSPEKAKSVIQQIAGDSAGLVFLDSQNGVAAFAPFSADEMGSLRVQGRLMRLFRAASKANARSAIMADPGGKLSPGQARNLRTAMVNLDIGLLDVITYASRGGEGPAKSWMSGMEGLPGTNPGNVVFSAASAGSAASPADRAIFDMAQDGMPAGEILSFIAKSSRSPFNRVLAAALGRVGVSSTGTLDDTGGWRFGNRSYAQRYAAAYNPTTDTVALFTPHEAERHVLHELVHAATLKAIAAGGPAAVRMRALFRHVQKSGRLDGQYGMSNVDEFVAEAFSNPRFQEALRGIPAPAGSTLKSAWQWFVRIVARIVGIRTQPSETALDRALTVGAQLMRENVALSDAATGKVPGAKNAKELLPSVLLNARNDAGVKPIVVDAPRDVNRGDIRFNIAGTQPAVTPPASPENLWQAAKARAAALLTPGRIDKLIYELQDKYVDLRRIRDHIREIGGTITDLNDAYLGEELYHKRLAHRTEDFLKAELRPLLADMKTRGVGMQELETFLHARHAPEANAEMARRNPNQAEIDAGRKNAAAVLHRLERNLQTAQARGLATKAIEQALNDARGDLVKWNGAQAFNGTEQERRSLSGMTDQAAAAIMAGLSPQRRADLDALAARVDDINAGTLQVLDDYGLMSGASLDAWRRTYQFYVPLHRDEAHPDSANHPVGQGFSVKGEAAKRRTGSNQKVTHILGHIAMQREAALTRGEKNRVMLKLYLMARQNPLPDVWKVGAVPMLDTIDKATGFVKSVPDPLYRNRPNVVTLRIAGKDVAITMNEHNPQALRMAQALKNLDVDDLHYLIPVVGRVTRWFAAMNTQYNPIFGVINMMRDLQAGALNLSTTELAGKQGQVLKDSLRILSASFKNYGRLPTTGPWAALSEDLNMVGGMTGYRDLFLTAEDRSKTILEEMKALDRGGARKAFHAVASWLSDYNEAMETAVRLAAYKAGLDSGMTKERAASLAKNLTVNFNRKGRQTRELGALYAFFNAAVQGTTRMAQTLAGPAGRKIMAGGVLAGAVSTVMGIAAMGGGDGEDDEWSKIPEFVKERSLIIPIGRDKYITIPMPLGFHFLPNIGRLAVEMAVYKDKTAGRQMASLATVLADAFNPLGGSAPALQIAAPTVLDPFVALAQNRDWTGKPIYIENFNSLDQKPGTQRAKDSATPWARGFAEAINAVTGGTEYTPGGWSPTPDQIDYVIGQLTGGLGREAGKVAATAAAPFTGEELPPYRIPLLGRLYGSTSGTSGQSEAFYENIRQANAAESEIKGRLKGGGGIADFLKENPHALELAALGNAAERQVRELRGIRRGIVNRGEPDAASRAREVNERMAAVMRGFNRQAERMQ